MCRDWPHDSGSGGSGLAVFNRDNLRCKAVGRCEGRRVVRPSDERLDCLCATSGARCWSLKQCSNRHDADTLPVGFQC